MNDQQWIRVSEALPPPNTVVDTKVDDGKIVTNEQKLQRETSLWFSPDKSVYVYYQPTHWRLIDSRLTMNEDFQELWIAFCRLIVYCNLKADTGRVWRTRQGCEGKHAGDFILGVGDGRDLGKQIFYFIPMDRWEECDFAKESEDPVYDFSITLEQMRQRTGNLITLRG